MFVVQAKQYPEQTVLRVLMCNFSASKTETEHYVSLQCASILHGLFGCLGDCVFSDCDFQENEALKWFMGDRLCLLLHHN